MNIESLHNVDPFDQPNFNPVEYFNKLFPDEGALGNLDPFMDELQVQIDSMESALHNSIRAQSLIGGKVAGNLQSAHDSMGVVFRNVTEIKQRAEHAEAMVTGICRDIRALDNAKRNITQSIKSVRRMQMLESALTQLQGLCKEDNYKEAAPLVHATQQLFLNFADRPDIPSLQQMAAQFNAIKTELTGKVMHRFPSYDPTVDGPPPPGMADACAIIDAVGGEAPKKFMKTFIQNQLEKYSRKFHRGESSALLSNVDKRYQWFRQYLEALTKHCNDVFPPEWFIPQEMAVEFCLLTHQQLSFQLQDEAGNLDAVVLVKALQKSQQFEKDLSVRWGGADDALAEEVGNRSAEIERIKMKYQKHRQQQGLDKNTAGASAERPQEPAMQYKFHGFITSCFDQAMQVYVDFEDQQMRETVDRLIAEETWGSSEEGPLGESEILTSASDLFIYIEEVLKRSSTLSRGSTLFKMHKVWCKNLGYYADKLGAVLAPQKGTQEKGERVISIIINTADYWSGIIEQMVNEIKAKVEEIHRNEVNLDAAHDSFSALINKCIRALIRSIETKMEPHFTDMLKMNWGQMVTVEDQSPYVSGLCQVLTDKMAVIVVYLNSSYLRLFCNKFVVYFLRRFIQQFYKCKRISETGCQQLLIDLQHLRQKLQDLPNEGNSERFTGPTLASYVKLLNQELKKAENVLKIIMAPPGDKNIPIDYAELAPHPSIPDFVKLMELKGMKKSDIGHMLEQLSHNKKVSKTEYQAADEDLDLQPQDLGTGSVFGEWKRRIGGSIKTANLPEYIKIGELSRAGNQFLGRTHASPSSN